MANDPAVQVVEQILADTEREYDKKYGKSWRSKVSPGQQLRERFTFHGNAIYDQLRSLYIPFRNRYLTSYAIRLWRYHPDFFPAGIKDKIDIDDDPFPKQVANTARIGEPYARKTWLENYYQRNPVAFRKAISNPVRMQQYFKENLRSVAPGTGTDYNILMMRGWVHNHIHVVQPGENLSHIAKRQHIPLTELKDYNSWLKNRPGGFGRVYPKDKIILPWRMPKDVGFRPFYDEISRIRPNRRQHYLRNFYKVNPRAAAEARREARVVIDWAHKYLRGTSTRSINPPTSFRFKTWQPDRLRQLARGLVNPHRSRSTMRSTFG